MGGDPYSTKSGSAKGALVFAFIVWAGGIWLNVAAGNPLVNLLTIVWTIMCIGLAINCLESANASHTEIRGNKTTHYYWDDDEEPPKRFR